ncbi:AAA family ATPase, partial [Vibrio cholerae]
MIEFSVMRCQPLRRALAVLGGFMNNRVVFTGGPGSGKT